MKETYKTSFDAENVFYKSGNFNRHYFFKNYDSEVLANFEQLERPVTPDLSVSGYFLWGHLKSVVYQTRPTNKLCPAQNSD